MLQLFVHLRSTVCLFIATVLVLAHQIEPSTQLDAQLMLTE